MITVKHFQMIKISALNNSQGVEMLLNKPNQTLGSAL